MKYEFVQSKNAAYFAVKSTVYQRGSGAIYFVTPHINPMLGQLPRGVKMPKYAVLWVCTCEAWRMAAGKGQNPFTDPCKHVIGIQKEATRKELLESLKSADKRSKQKAEKAEVRKNAKRSQDIKEGKSVKGGKNISPKSPRPKGSPKAQGRAKK